MDLFTALACDYGRVGDNPLHHDGQTLGPHSILRLEEMWKGVSLTYSCGERNIMFVFSAGRLHSSHRRLCDLQDDWVQSKWRSEGWDGNPFIVSPNDTTFWGTDGEIAFLKLVLYKLLKQGCDTLNVEVVTEDYHAKRVRYLLGVAGLRQVRLIQTSSASCPPLPEELRHEWRAYFMQRYMPRWVVLVLQNVSRRVRARRYGLAVG